MPGDTLTLTYDKLWQSSEEQVEPIHGKVKGTIPSALNGIYLRVGPGKFDFDTGETLNHYFDGYSLLSKFTICSNDSERNMCCTNVHSFDDNNNCCPPSVTYESKFLDSDAYKKSMAAQRPMANEFGTGSSADVGKSYLHRLCKIPAQIMIPNLTDNCLAGFFQHDKDLFVMGDTSSFHEININTLSSITRHDMPRYYGFYLFTPHPLKDIRTGDSYNIGTSGKTGLKHNILRIPPKPSNLTPREHFKRNGKIIATIPSRWNTLASCNHSFGLSENYIIFIEQPLLLNAGRFIALGLLKNEPYKEWLEWHPEYMNRFYVIQKKTGKILTTEFLSAQPFFFFHMVNCYEDNINNELIVDISCFNTPEILDLQYTVKTLRAGYIFDETEKAASIRRFVIPLGIHHGIKGVSEGINLVKNGHTERIGKSIICYPHELIERGLEMWTLNSSSSIGRNYTFAYGSSMMVKGDFERQIIKLNVKTKEILKWTVDQFSIVGEALFVPRKVRVKAASLLGVNGTISEEDEDDGYLIVPSMDLRQGYPDRLYFLDAKTMEEIGHAEFNVRIPPALHGHYLPT